MSRKSVSRLAWGQVLLLCSPLVLCGQPASQQATEATAPAAKSASPAASSAAPIAGLRAGTTISAMLESRVDARTAKPGDKIVARVTKNVKRHGRILVHKGGQMIGHVTAVEEGTYKAGSRVSLAFNQFVNGGVTWRLNAVLSKVVSIPGQGILPGGQMGGDSMAPAFPASMSGGGARGVNEPAAGSEPRPSAGASQGSSVIDRAANAVGQTGPGSDAHISLSTPLQEVRVGPDAHAKEPTAGNSVLKSKHGNLRLDSGTRVKFRVVAESASSGIRK
jgi:hypothetical protein